jgi:hypothetical protein
MITRNLTYSFPDPTEEEIMEVTSVVDNMRTKPNNGKTHIKAVPSYTVSGNIIKLTVCHMPMSCNIWTSIKGALNKALGTGRIY